METSTSTPAVSHRQHAALRRARRWVWRHRGMAPMPPGRDADADDRQANAAGVRCLGAPIAQPPEGRARRTGGPTPLHHHTPSGVDTERPGPVLVVDDTASAAAFVSHVLRVNGYVPVIAQSADEALLKLDREPFSLVVSDLVMPHHDGLWLLEEVQTHFPSVAFVLMTGQPDVATAVQAMHRGAYDYLTKPVGAENLVFSARRAIEAHTLRKRAERYQAQIEAMLESAREDAQDAREETLHRLALVAEHRDDETGAHGRRIGELAQWLAERLVADAEFGRRMRLAAPLHDIGKIAIPDQVLRKDGRLNQAENALMRQHCEHGRRILDGARCEILQLASRIALTHHERWDGCGYPNGLAGSAIPLEGRIVALADVFDALTSKRCYKDALPVRDAVALIRAESGTHFDPTVVAAFLDWAETTRLHGE